MREIRSLIHTSLQDFYTERELRSLSLIICKDLLGLNDLDVYCGKDINLSVKQRDELGFIIHRLQQQEPIQYICGKVSFGECEFLLTPAVLIPRPETWELVQQIIDDNPMLESVLDIGTGSGCIAVSLAKHFPNARVEAWDVSREALEVARQNNEKNETQVRFEQHDVLQPMKTERKYQLLVSNPPYVLNRERREMERNVLDYEPSLALFVPDDDPLLFYRRIAELGRDLLERGGSIYFEVNRAFGQETLRMLTEKGYTSARVWTDFYGNDRFVSAVYNPKDEREND